MNKTISIIILVLIAASSNAQQPLDGAINSLSLLLTDSYSSIVKKSIHTLEYKKKSAFIVTFSIEGYDLGNNYQQFLGVFTHEYKKHQEPPFEAYGDPKIRMIGYSQLCSSPLEVFNSKSLKIINNRIEGACYKKRSNNANEKKFELLIKRHDIEIQSID